jgi:ABC-type transport system substrate-binding protein
MWIKRALVIVPILLFAFLIQSIFWAPMNESAADNEGRQHRIIFYMSGDPTDMNPWSSSTTLDSTLTQYFFDGLLKYDRMYEITPSLSTCAAIHHELVAPVPQDMTLESFEQWVRDKHGASVTAFMKVSDGVAEGKVYDLASGKELAGTSADKAAVRFRTPATVRITLSAPIEDGRITSAVVPEFGQDLYGKNLEKLLEPLGGLTHAEMKGADVARLFRSIGFGGIEHNPVVEMKVRRGIYWTDGPFFSNPERTWSVTINGDFTANVVADSADAAVNEIRERHDLAGENVEAVLYEHRFGEESNGPWWGRGPEMTAKDPKLTYDYIRNPDFGSPRLSSWLDVKEVRIDEKDPFRLMVVYKKLFSPALSNLTGALIPYHTWNNRAWTDEAIRKERSASDLGVSKDDYNVMRALPMAERDFRHRPQSCGPMVMEPLNGEARPLWKSAQIATLRRNDFFWDRKPEYEFLDYLIFDPSLGRETAEIGFLSGNMDIYGAQPYQVERYGAMTDDYYVLQRETTTYEYLGFNCRKGPLANPKVRLALSMAIDVDEIVKYVEYGQAQRIAGPAYPVLPWYDTEYRREHKWRTGPNAGKVEKLPFIPFNLTEARALLKEEGFEIDSSGTLVKDGAPFKIRLVNSAGGGTRADIALIARENWQNLGVKVELEEYEWNVFIGQYALAGNFDVLVLGWSGGLNFDKRQLFHSDFMPPRGYDFVGYKNEKANALMDRILTVYDPAEQIRLCHEIFGLIADDCPYVFLYSDFATSVMDKRVVWRKQVGTNPDGSIVFENRPVSHEHITKAKATLAYFVPELKRLEEAPEFTEEDYRR